MSTIVTETPTRRSRDRKRRHRGKRALCVRRDSIVRARKTKGRRQHWSPSAGTECAVATNEWRHRLKFRSLWTDIISAVLPFLGVH